MSLSLEFSKNIVDMRFINTSLHHFSHYCLRWQVNGQWWVTFVELRFVVGQLIKSGPNDRILRHQLKLFLACLFRFKRINPADFLEIVYQVKGLLCNLRDGPLSL